MKGLAWPAGQAPHAARRPAFVSSRYLNPCPPAHSRLPRRPSPPLFPTGACRLDLTHDGQALCLVACGVATCAAVSAAVQAPHYMRHRTVLAVSIRIMCAWLGNWIIACMHGPVQDMRGWADFGLRRVVTGSLALLALGARLGPAASVLLLLAQAATVLATQRAACGGHLRIHPNYGDFLRPAAAALTAGAAWLVGPYQGPPPAVPTCDAALCWAVVAWTDTALLTLCTAVGLALGGETGVKWGGGRAAAWAGASVFGLAAYWRVLDRAAPDAVPCR